LSRLAPPARLPSSTAVEVQQTAGTLAIQQCAYRERGPRAGPPVGVANSSAATTSRMARAKGAQGKAEREGQALGAQEIDLQARIAVFIGPQRERNRGEIVHNGNGVAVFG